MSNEEDSVITEVAGRIARITLNRPDKRNPLDWSTIRRLRAAVEELEQNLTAQVVLISGAGGHFSAGGDLVGYLDLYRRPEDFRQFLSDFHKLLGIIEASRKIYIAVITGYCVAGGLELLLACDIVLAAHSARIGDAHLTFGQLPGAGGSQRLPRTIGSMRARHLLLTGEVLAAADAERIGLVSKIVPDDGLSAETDRVVNRLLATSPLGLSGMKHLASKGMQMSVDDALRMELDYVVRYASTSSDAFEGLLAFQEKRKPRFTGA